jgi:hypothetical protein
MAPYDEEAAVIPEPPFPTFGEHVADPADLIAQLIPQEQ